MADGPVHETFNQPPALENFNRYTGNRALRDALAREGAGWADEALIECGAILGTTAWIARGELANRHPPRLNIYDRFGERADAFEFHPAWHECLTWLKAHGLAGATWSDTRIGAHVRRAALFQLFAEVECGSLCPTTMTHGAVPVIAREPALLEPWAHLAARPDYDARDIPASDKRGVLIGMGMTERQGGSDVRTNTTRAEACGDGWFRLTGHKWFFSVAMSDAFLVTAQAAGGLSCFFMPRFTPDGQRNAIHLLRAKDKLGDRSNASAEVEFHGAMAHLVGTEGRGIATVLETGNHTRLDCANGSAGIMRGALAQAVHHARHRRAFGNALIDQPLMKNVLADMALELEGHVALCLHVAACVDKSCHAKGGHDLEEAKLLGRLLTPVAKYWVCKRTPPLVAEALEVTGGNGYVEDGPMPRLFRQSPLNSIWEGAGNVMCLDVLRVFAREPQAADTLLAGLERACAKHPIYDRALNALKKLLRTATVGESDARLLTEHIALLTQAELLLHDGVTPVAEAFCASRLDGHPGRAFGSLARNTAFNDILDRAGP